MKRITTLLALACIPVLAAQTVPGQNDRALQPNRSQFVHCDNPSGATLFFDVVDKDTVLSSHAVPLVHDQWYVLARSLTRNVVVIDN